MANWRLRRGDDEWILTFAELVEWKRDGRVKPNDYVWNPTLERWTYASEVRELPAERPQTRRVVILLAIIFVLLFLLSSDFRHVLMQ